MNNKENSPFTPGSPVPVELFVGRTEQIEEILRYVNQAASGKQENVFLEGDRGIGKSSLAFFLRSLVADRENILGIHVSLGRLSTLEEMVRHIFDRLLKETKGQKWFNKIEKLFGKYIRQVGLFGVSVSFSPPEEDLKQLVRNFPEALGNLLENIKEEKKGLFIALDDINGFVDKVEFANWYKSVVDEVATHYKSFPVFILLIGQPEQRNSLASLQPSLMRIFRVVEIERLADKEVEQFLSQAFENTNITLKRNALSLIIKMSSGLPILMHEIGDAVFWADTDGVVDREDVLQGIVKAAENVGQKYLDPKVYRALRSPRYRSILRKLGEISISRNFKKREVEARLNEDEKIVFHNFLRRIRDLGVIETDMERGLGAYRFVNEIYPIYIWMEGKRFKKN
jgi:hypothetical protein